MWFNPLDKFFKFWLHEAVDVLTLVGIFRVGGGVDLGNPVGYAKLDELLIGGVVVVLQVEPPGGEVGNLTVAGLGPCSKCSLWKL